MKKRLFAMFLAFSITVSGLSVNAAEMAENVIGEAVVTEENTDESESVIDKAVNSSGSEAPEPETAKDVRVAGSNGVLYENVMYLSAKTVMTLDEDVQSVYYNVCDEIAFYKENGYELEDVVIAADADGNLYFSASISTKVLDDIQAGMVQGITGKFDQLAEQSETLLTIKEPSEEASLKKEAAEKEFVENKSVGIMTEAEIEDVTIEDVMTEDVMTEDVMTEDIITETETEDSTIEDIITETETGDAATEDIIEDIIIETEDATTENIITETEDIAEEESATDKGTEADTSEKETDAEEGSTEEEPAIEESAEEERITAEESENETETEVLAMEEEDTTEAETIEELIPEPESLADENMDLLPFFEEETFDVIETVRVDNIIDLGYGNNSDRYQINTIEPASNYFYSQLTAEEKRIYNAAKPRFTGGSNSFSCQFHSVGDFNWNPICHAVSALWLVYPDKLDWMAKPGNIRVKGSYVRGSSAVNYTISFDKSKFYSGSLDAKAKTQIQELANDAQQYAAENYPNAPVYGIVKFFDSWICENNYYEMIGALDNIKEQSNEMKKIYYYCHSAYGILLNGYGVCESYAKAMSRLLDAVGIPNVYVLGDTSGGFHAWNYVQMPDESWYLVDATWNDSTDVSQTWSRGTYLLTSDDENHIPTGASWYNERNFSFPSLAAAKYTPSTESIAFGLEAYYLKPKEKETIAVSGMDYIRNAPKTWSSSDTKVAKVDSKGKVTAVAPGKATITLAAAGMAASCEVYVDQVKSVTSANTNKNTDALSFGLSGTQGTYADTKNVVLNVNMGNSPHNAAWMVAEGKVSEPVITYTNKKASVVTADIQRIDQNQITLRIKPNTVGSTNVKVAFAGKTVTIKVSVGNVLSEDWFAIERIDGDRTPYTGKAIKPKVTKTTTEKVTYKVSYLNNKNAGTATVRITGTGKYGGDIIYNFTITPIDITDADFSKALKSKPYNGGSNAPATTVKLGKKTLKANTDYTILYNGKELTAVPAGTYTIAIKGKGNYAGTVARTQRYTVNKNTIAKVTASCSSTVKYTGRPQNPVAAKIGKNILPESDYTVVYHIGSSKNGKEISRPLAKGKYTAVITVRGDNLTTTARKTEIVKKFTVK